jgi:hypothetical protein
MKHSSANCTCYKLMTTFYHSLRIQKNSKLRSQYKMSKLCQNSYRFSLQLQALRGTDRFSLQLLHCACTDSSAYILHCACTDSSAYSYCTVPVQTVQPTATELCLMVQLHLWLQINQGEIHCLCWTFIRWTITDAFVENYIEMNISQILSAVTEHAPFVTNCCQYSYTVL